MNLKNNKGISGVDLSIAVFIFIIFSGIFAGLIYNINISAKDIERRATATYITIQTLENLKATEYSEIPQYIDDNCTLVNSEQTLNNVTDGYKVVITLEKYNEKEGNTSLEDVITEATVKTTYSVGKKTGQNAEEIEISTLLLNK